MASLALLSWPLIALLLFAIMRPAKALIWTIVAGYLLLPERFGFDFSGLPPIDKVSILSISAVLGAALLAHRYKTARPDLMNRNPRIGATVFFLLGLVVIGNILTVQTNGGALRFGPRVLPGLATWEIISLLGLTAFTVAPYFLARRYLATPQSHRMLLIAMLVAGLIYSIPVLAEVRLSPQLNIWFYGYFQHSFAQHIRGGGFRPLVFLQHGLWLGFFLFTVVVAAFALARSKETVKRVRILLTAIWMSGVLLLSQNLGATVLAMFFVPLIWLFGPRFQVGLAAAIAVAFLLFPAARQAGVVPTNQLVSAASAISPARAASLQYRFDNEDALLARALQRPIAGWGRYGRNRIYDEEGNDISTTDGVWVIILGSRGWLGYVGFFGLLTFPLFSIVVAARRKPITRETAGLCIMMAGNLIYMIPNSTLSPIGWMIAGALAGFAQFDTQTTAAPAAQKSERGAGKPRYTRFGGDQPVHSRVQSRTLHRRSTSTP